MVPTPSYDVGCPSTTLSTNYATLAAEKNKNQKIKISSKTKNEKSEQKLHCEFTNLFFKKYQNTGRDFMTTISRISYFFIFVFFL